MPSSSGMRMSTTARWGSPSRSIQRRAASPDPQVETSKPDASNVFRNRCRMSGSSSTQRTRKLGGSCRTVLMKDRGDCIPRDGASSREDAPPGNPALHGHVALYGGPLVHPLLQQAEERKGGAEMLRKYLSYTVL